MGTKRLSSPLASQGVQLTSWIARWGRPGLIRPTPITALGIVLILLTGCDAGQPDGEHPPTNLDDGVSGVPTITLTEVSSAAIIGIPAGLVATGGMLWVRDAAGDPGIHMLDSESGELLQSFGSRGDGPGDFSTRPFGLVKEVEAPGTVWAWDLGHQRLTRLDPLPWREYEVQTINLEVPPTVQRVVRTEGGRFIGVAGSEESRFVLFAPDGSRERVIAHPLPGPEEAPHRSRINAANQAIAVCAWPGRGFVVANSQFGQIDYYDHSGGHVRSADVPFPSDPIFEPDAAGVPTFRWRESHYVSCTATERALYALHSGRDLASHDSETAGSGNVIHVFTWSGELLATYRLDRDVSRIFVDGDRGLVYASSLPDAAIYRFSLPDI